MSTGILFALGLRSDVSDGVVVVSYFTNLAHCLRDVKGVTFPLPSSRQNKMLTVEQ